MEDKEVLDKIFSWLEEKLEIRKLKENLADSSTLLGKLHAKTSRLDAETSKIKNQLKEIEKQLQETNRRIDETNRRIDEIRLEIGSEVQKRFREVVNEFFQALERSGYKL